ncbi:MAG: hypothetical protein KJ970_12900 [Candidatus Eisenbacteria bacterium]|uniref:Uncharacterized protein n=1 Tax=Eiseniibacteriota bacterium TaxID=2212470 RepID=A0A948RZ52_UNCEI|nr:hypothetical protein [Candidatus Eisenbacteria bacterium]MBU1947274.1 hypothetical protein [Candidatus Eisenbacteria bacterium]MBU2691812.1 hypothetical protein [Candidatus Eisenbacteria bacterium]
MNHSVADNRCSAAGRYEQREDRSLADGAADSELALIESANLLARASPIPIPPTSRHVEPSHHFRDVPILPADLETVLRQSREIH